MGKHPARRGRLPTEEPLAFPVRPPATLTSPGSRLIKPFLYNYNYYCNYLPFIYQLFYCINVLIVKNVKIRNF